MLSKYELIASTLLIDLMLDHRGKDNAVHSRVLERRFGISGRVLRSIVRNLRLEEGHPICSCSKGYYYPETQNEIIDTFSSLRASTMSYSKLCEGLLFNKQVLNNIQIFGGCDNDELPID